jgi:prepilin-type N-terminal cleavage/methylation domain-containing protein/prepilin-type processing-associated H-X9-DG protein
MPRRGFTLIELLVVVAIIALLISLILPSLAGAREAARRAKCESNLRQIATALNLYAQDFKETVVLANWASLDKLGAGWLYKPPIQFLAEHRRTGTLWQYLEADEVYRCPTHKEPFKKSANLTSYLMNGATVAFGRAKRPFRMDQFSPTSAIYWEADEDQGGWNDGSSYPTEGLTKRHGKGATMGFIDGHTEWWTHQRYDDEELRAPGRLWFAPDTKDGK